LESHLPAQLILQAILILINAFFAASEIAFLSLNPVKLRKMEDDGDTDAALLVRMVENPNRFLSTIQVGITLAGYLGSAFAASSFASYLVDWLYDRLGFRALPLSVLNTLSIIVITLIISFFSITFGEMVPKRIAMQKPLAVARVSIKVVKAVGVVAAPMIAALNAATNASLHILGLKTQTEEGGATEEDIRLMVESGGEQGTIEQDEQKWIENVFDFGDMTASDAMTPEPDVTAISTEDTDEEILKTIQQTGLSRFPVYEEDINDICGILNARDFLLNLQRKERKPIKALLRPAYFVPESIHANQLFKDMQSKKMHIAVVVDEYGGTCGIVTIEDLLEQIVGNIYDEFDPVEPQEIQPVGENKWRVSGSVRVEDLAEALDIDLPESDDYDTVAGMVFSCLHTIPQDGTVLTVETNGLRIQVEKIEDRKIVRALVQKLPEPAKDSAPKKEDE
jgi:putative hemolysin